MSNKKKYFPYVLSELHGGIGNLLFQYIGAITISKKIGGRLVFIELEDGAKDWLENYLGKSITNASNLEIILMCNMHTIEKKIPNIKNNYYKNKFFKISKLLGLTLGKKYRDDPIFTSYKKIPIPKSFSGINSLGYYQHPDFFINELEYILTGIGTNFFGDKYIKAKLHSRTVIQLRRGDYLRHKGWTLNKEYYLKSLMKYDPLKKDPVIVLSNDDFAIDAMEGYCKEIGYKIEKLDPEEKLNDTYSNLPVYSQSGKRDFLAIAESSRVIMSNCTYCWWACMLGDHIFNKENRTVVYPKGWIKEYSDVLNTNDWPEEKT